MYSKYKKQTASKKYNHTSHSHKTHSHKTHSHKTHSHKTHSYYNSNNNHNIKNEKDNTKYPLFTIEQFQDFVLNERNIEYIIKNASKNIDKHIKKDINDIHKSKNQLHLTKQGDINNWDNEFITPRYKDSLFWCFYIMENGISNYEMIHSDGFKEAIQYKIHLVEKIRKHKDILKKYKFKKNKIETTLVNSNFIDISTFMCICAVHNYNVVIIDNRKFYKLFQNDQPGKNLCIIKKNNNKFRLCIGDQKIKMDMYNSCVTDKWEITNISKPLNAISGYKLKQLQDICKKLRINIYNDKKTFIKKSILYQNIQKQL